MRVAMRRLVGINVHAANRIAGTSPGSRSGRTVNLIVMRVRGHGSVRGATGLVLYTPDGYIRLMRKDIKASCAKRLNRIEGQVRGLSRMVEQDRYCIDIVTQVAAVRAALRRLEEEILRDHVGHCVEHAVASGNKADQRRKIEELMAVVCRAER
jgi:CsoR family transcriptional regulator, copper-sensing transcriptional repressor